MRRATITWQRGDERTVSRRTFLRGASVATVGAGALVVAGCSDDSPEASETRATSAARTATPAAGVMTGASPSPAAAAGFRWRKLEAGGGMPRVRRDHALVSDADGKRVFLFGGRTAGQPAADLWVYDLAAARWTELRAEGGPAARFGHNTAFDHGSGTLLVFGGQAGSSFFNDAWAYDPSANRWRQLDAGSARPQQRYGAATAWDEAARTLYVSHGFTDRGRFDDTWRLSAAQGGWQDASPAAGRPLKRCLVRGGWDAARNRMLIFGGQSNESAFHGDLWSLEGGAWREVAAAGAPSPRNLYAAWVDPARQALVIAGGRTASGDAGDLWQLDLATDRWSALSPTGEAPSARSGHDAVLLRGSSSAFLFGGVSGATELADAWLLEGAA